MSAAQNHPLRPCPFCQSKRVELSDYYGKFAVVCTECGAHGTERTDPDLAVEYWNGASEMGRCETCRHFDPPRNGLVGYCECYQIPTIYCVPKGFGCVYYKPQQTEPK